MLEDSFNFSCEIDNNKGNERVLYYPGLGSTRLCTKFHPLTAAVKLYATNEVTELKNIVSLSSTSLLILRFASPRPHPVA